jgi:putative ABC transport system permease protein
LALGIGTNTAIFRVVNAVLLQPLPYPNPKAIVLLFENVGKTGHDPVSYPNFLDWQRADQVSQTLAAYAQSEINLTSEGNSEHLSCEIVSDDYFDLLGVHAILGRTFLSEENHVPSERSVVLIGYGL